MHREETSKCPHNTEPGKQDFLLEGEMTSLQFVSNVLSVQAIGENQARSSNILIFPSLLMKLPEFTAVCAHM